MIRAAVLTLMAAFLPATSGATDPLIRPDLCPGGNQGYFARHPVSSVNFSIFLQPLDAAIQAAASVDDERFRVKIWRAARGDQWRINIEYRDLPTAEQFASDTGVLDKLSTQLSGEFWPASCTSFPFKASTVGR